MSTLNTNFDNEFDNFFNLDDNTPASSSSDSKSLGPFATSSNQQTFPGPSYQYDTLRQQTGLPVGGLANTFAVNQANGLHYRQGNNGFVMPTETLNIPLTNMDEFDFNRPQLDMTDMDVEGDSPTDMPTMFYPSASQQQTPQRIYPGMHTQQAAQAKAQKQQEMMRQAQQPQQIAGQRPLPPTQTPKTPSSKDPHVEESISRLLSRMRQNSTVSNEDGDSPVTGMSNMPRFKKDEDDMDEDERLLNSEEGKKLSSKERRQLRNKVSARAFRSRRKEYITQLESEVAAKVQEANDLRVQNRQLMEENTRLTDLTRMLLSSQAFSGFLQELSASGGPVNANLIQQSQSQQRPQQQSQQQSQQQQSAVPKDVATHEASRKMSTQNHQMQVGMTLIPETNFDVFDSSAWNHVVPSNDFQVYAVTELPEPPKLDLSALTGKNSTSSSSSNKEAPVLPTIPGVANLKAPTVSETIDETVELDENDFTLFFDSRPVTATKFALDVPTPLLISISKAGLTSELNTKLHEQKEVADSWEALQHLCDSVEESCDNLDSFLPN